MSSEYTISFYNLLFVVHLRIMIVLLENKLISFDAVPHVATAMRRIAAFLLLPPTVVIGSLSMDSHNFIDK